MRDEKSLAHTRWNCKYHIVFAPKYRRQVFYREKRRAIGSILRKLCEWKNVNILEAEYCVDHIHMLLESPQDECLGIYGVPEGKEQSDAL
ncbi:transposase IS200 like family protein [Yersinia pestis]|nr:transposase IS200 like family protein [Yersinia pestis]AJK09716.1 transposase IS200 like family protein [Yersinia pestis]AJK10255.1 transposase IS200 like family protein [Yersinia pestis]